MIAVLKKDNWIINAIIEDDKVRELSVFTPDEYMRIGSIYVGKVKNIVKNIDSCFVEFSNKEQGYYNIVKEEPIFVNGKSSGDKLKAEDEILVQIKREVKANKPVTLTSKIELSTHRIVLIMGKTGINVSKKIKDKDEKERLKNILSNEAGEGYSLIARTDCVGESEETIVSDIKKLKEEMKGILKKAKSLKAFSALKPPVKSYLSVLSSVRKSYLDKIITNDKEIFQEINAFQNEAGSDEVANNIPVELWDEENGKNPDIIYRITTTLDKSLQSNVWLKHGGFLIIEHTQALTVIDVNSGGDIKKKKKAEEFFFDVNKEAAIEICNQIRLRNISGIIIIDFIDMADKKKKDELLHVLREEFLKDSIKSVVVDITKLGLVEITRKRVLPPLYEQVNKCKRVNENNGSEE
ncbi:MAG: ribonuclease E/G [Lachnospiraceae bacterium]|nr:ribonuclease E/G [Lachnospiraceae bacterium]